MVFYPPESAKRGNGLALGNVLMPSVYFRMIRRRLDPISRSPRFPSYRVTRGESSHYTLPRVVLCVDQRVLCVMYEIMCYVLCVCCYRPDRRVQRYRPGQRAQRAMTGPEGPTSYGTGGSR